MLQMDIKISRVNDNIDLIRQSFIAEFHHPVTLTPTSEWPNGKELIATFNRNPVIPQFIIIEQGRDNTVPAIITGWNQRIRLRITRFCISPILALSCKEKSLLKHNRWHSENKSDSDFDFQKRHKRIDFFFPKFKNDSFSCSNIRVKL